MGRARDRLAVIGQDEGAGPVSPLCLPEFEAGLADGRRLLIADEAADRDRPPEPFLGTFGERAVRIDDARQAFLRHAEEVA